MGMEMGVEVEMWECGSMGGEYIIIFSLLVTASVGTEVVKKVLRMLFDFLYVRMLPLLIRSNK